MSRYVHPRFEPRRRGFLVATAVGCCAIPAPAWSQDAPAPETLPASPPVVPPAPLAALENPETAADDAAVVRTSPPPMRTAGDYDLSLGTLGFVPHLNATDALQMVPGVSVTNEAGEGDGPEIQLRGFVGDNGQDIAFSIEGVPVNDESNPLTHGNADLLSVMPELLAGLRVTEGVADPRQGNFALAGSIDVRLGLAQRGLSVLGSVGSYGYHRLAAFWGPTDAADPSFVGVEVVHADGFGPQRSWDRASGLAQHAVDLGHGTTLRVLAGLYAGSWQNPGFVAQGDYLAGTEGFFAVYPDQGVQGGFSARGILSVTLTHDRDGTRTELKVFGMLRDFWESENADGFVSDPVHGDTLSERYSGGTLGASGYYRRTVALGGLSQEIEAGFWLRHDRYDIAEQSLDHATNLPTTPPNPDDSTGTLHVTNPAAYLDGTVRPARWLTLRGGARVDAFAYDAATTVTASNATTNADAFGTHVGPKASVVVGPWRNFRLLASYGTGFRSPDAATVAGGAPVQFSVASTEDVTLRYALGDEGSAPRLVASVTGFHTMVAGDAVFSPTQGTTVSVGDTDRLGAVFWARGRPLPWIDVGGSVAYTHATVENTALGGLLGAGATLPYLPQWVGRIDAAMDRQIATVWGIPVRLHAGVGASYRGYAPLLTLPSVPGYFLVDALVGLRARWVSLDLTAKNLLDAAWHAADFEYPANFHPGATVSATPVQVFNAGAPRTLYATLTLHL